MAVNRSFRHWRNRAVLEEHAELNIKPASTLALSAPEAPEVLNIVTGSDEHYAQHLTVMLASLFENNRNHVVNVFTMVPNDAHEYIFSKVRNSLGKFSQNLHFCETDQSALGNLKICKHLTLATYYRLLMAEVLPHDLHRILYLDSDILIRGNLGELWNFDIGDSVVGAAADVPDVEYDIDRKRKLGFHPDAPYFNSGVLLVDLDRWREANVGREALDFARSYPERLEGCDEPALNWVLRDRWAPLPKFWNLQTNDVARFRWGFMDYAKEARKQAKAAKIVHFTGSSKPWHYMNNHPLKREYLAYLKRTHWRIYKYPDYCLRSFIRRNLYRFAPFVLRVHYFIGDRFPVWRRLVSAPS